MKRGDIVWIMCSTVVWAEENHDDVLHNDETLDKLLPGEILLVLDPKENRYKEIKVLSPRGAVGWVATDILFQ